MEEPTTADIDSALRSEVPARYRDALAKADFPLDKLRELGRVRPGRISADLLLTACSLAAVPLAYAAVPGPLMFVVCFTLSLRSFNCLAQLVHTSDHGGLFRSARLNRIVGNVCAYCLGYTRTGHRLTHLNHHLYLNTERDPDRIWGAPDQSTRALFRMWLRDFFALSAAERLLQYSQSDRKTFSVAPWKQLTPGFLAHGLFVMLPVLVTHGLILAFYAVAVGPVFYFALYVLPILTIYPAQIRLRSTVEHSFDVGYRPLTRQDRWVSRSTAANLIERFVFSPFGIHHHFEHHLFPAIPHYNLGRVHRLLLERGVPVPITRGYLAFVLEKIRAERLAVAATELT